MDPYNSYKYHQHRTTREAFLEIINAGNRELIKHLLASRHTVGFNDKGFAHC